MPIRWVVDELLEMRGMTRYRLAVNAGLTPSGLNRLLNKPDVKRIRVETLDALARTLGVRPLELLADDD